jgi:D-alanyl-D-alanine carboxypeptidase/D-alanyl-D-alanine-endopeptidase (penicillin-binding protein 4)
MKKIFVFILIISINLFATSIEEAKSRIEQIINNLPESTDIAILVYNPLTKDTIFKYNSKKPMIPASNTKLFTTATALELMGGDYHLRTVLATTDKKLGDGVIDGDLFIKGYGNSLFTDDDIKTLASELKEKGITKIKGNIVGDDSYFDEVYERSKWIVDGHRTVQLPPISALVINRNTRTIYRRVHGRLRRYISFIKNPPYEAALLLERSLRHYGIKVYGKAAKGKTPSDTVELASSDILLKDLIRKINKHSDNFLAECLFKTLGAYASEHQGNSFYSTQTVLDFIDNNGIYSKGTAFVDGSGISKYDNITPCAVVGLLEKMYFDLKNFPYFYNSLSIAGVDGTLEDRMINTPAQNNFRGKTGTLNGVSSLSGYLKTTENDDLIISMFFNFDERNRHFYRRIEDEIVTDLTSVQLGQDP